MNPKNTTDTLFNDLPPKNESELLLSWLLYPRRPAGRSGGLLLTNEQRAKLRSPVHILQTEVVEHQKGFLLNSKAVQAGTQADKTACSSHRYS